MRTVSSILEGGDTPQLAFACAGGPFFGPPAASVATGSVVPYRLPTKGNNPTNKSKPSRSKRRSGRGEKGQGSGRTVEEEDGRRVQINCFATTVQQQKSNEPRPAMSSEETRTAYKLKINDEKGFLSGN